MFRFGDKVIINDINSSFFSKYGIIDNCDIKCSVFRVIVDGDGKTWVDFSNLKLIENFKKGDKVSYLNTFFTENHRILLKKKIEAIL